MMSDSALDLTKAGYWLIDYSDPDYYISSERAAAIFGERPRPGYRYHLTDEWYSRIAAADPAVAEATGVHYAAAVAGKVPRYDATYCYRRPGRRQGGLDTRHRQRRARRERQAALHVRRHAGCHRDQAGRAGDTARQADRGGGHEGQVRLPGQHEPRDPHADERRPRDDAARAQDRADAASRRTTSPRSTSPPPRCSASSTTSWTSRRSRPASWPWSRSPSTWTRSWRTWPRS